MCGSVLRRDELDAKKREMKIEQIRDTCKLVAMLPVDVCKFRSD